MALRHVLLLAALPVAALSPAAGGPPPAGAQGTVTVEGAVRSFTLGPDGNVNGLLLDDGEEVRIAGDATAALERAARPGDVVHVTGWRSPTPGVLTATAITDARTGKAIAGPGAPPPPVVGRSDAPLPPGLPPAGASEVTLLGRVLQPLHAADGRTDGALLGDGMQLRLPPDAAARLADLLEPGEAVAAVGYAMRTPYGAVMRVQAIGPSPESLTSVTPGPPPPVAPAAPASGPPPAE